MKKIESITVEVKYTVTLNDLEVKDDVYESLRTAYDKGGFVPASCEVNDDALIKAAEWLEDKIHESDAHDWEYSIDDFEEE